MNSQENQVRLHKKRKPGFLYFILILGGSRQRRELLRMSYTERNSNVKFANLFRFGIILK